MEEERNHWNRNRIPYGPDSITPSCRHRKSHCGDNTVLRLSYLYNGTLYTSKMVSLYRITGWGTQDVCKGYICGLANVDAAGLC